MITGRASLLRLHLDASASWRGKPLYRAVVESARALPVAGASVFLVDLSFGNHRQLRDAQSEYLFAHVPVVVEIVDAADRVAALLDATRAMITNGLVTLEDVRVVNSARDGRELVDDPLPANLRGTPMTTIEGKARRVTVYVGSSDTWRGRNMAMAIVERCRKMGLAGATASLGVMGFGGNSVIHRAHLFGISEDAPEKIEIVDRPERIDELLPILEEMVDGGLILVQDVEVVRHATHSTAP